MVAVQYIRGASTPGTKELESSCWSLVHIEMKKLDSNASEGRITHQQELKLHGQSTALLFSGIVF